MEGYRSLTERHCASGLGVGINIGWDVDRWSKTLNFNTMSTLELKQKLIEKIQKTDNNGILEEAYRLLELESNDSEVYQLNTEQLSAVAEAREQIRQGKFLTDTQADKDDTYLKFC